MRIPFFRAEGAGNDFLFSWAHDLPEGLVCPAFARAICHRNFGVGGDGWYVMSRTADADARIHLYNSDGSEAELSGNGTRCAAAVLVELGLACDRNVVRIFTGSGPRELRLLGHSGATYQFEMAMGETRVEALHEAVALASGAVDATIIDVGNPQCSLDAATLGHTSFDFDWRALGEELERHPRFPRRSNVSFFLKRGANTIEARFFERGAGSTLSSGTGATGAAVAAYARGLVASPVTVNTEAGPLQVRWEGAQVHLGGPARIIARGEYYWDMI